MRLRKALIYLKQYKLLVLGLLITTLGTTIFGTFYPYFTGIIIDDIFSKGNLADLFQLIIIIFIVFCIHQIFRFLNLHLLKIFYTKFIYNLKIRMFKNVLHFKNEEMITQNTGDLIQRIERDSTSWVEYLYNNIAYGLSDWLVFLIQLIFLFVLSPFLFLLTCLCMPIYTFSSKYYENKILKKENEAITILSSLNSFIVEFAYNIAEIRLISAIINIKQKLKQKYKLIMQTQITIKRLQFSSSRVNVGISIIMRVLFLITSFLLMRNKFLSLGEFVACFSYFEASLAIFYDLNNKSNTKNKYFVAMERTTDLLKSNESNDDNNKNTHKHISTIHKIIFNDVSFNYGSKCIFDKINLIFQKGKLHYIIGESGSGKSTLVDLLSGLYSPSTGTILYDTLEAEKVKKDISVMHQQTFLFNDTLLFNLCLENSIPEKTIWDVLKKVNLDTRIKNMPNQLNFVINEDNKIFSGGELQRLALARIILQNRKIMILDEPISALDKENRMNIINYLNTLSSDKLIIIVTHNTEVIGTDSNIFKLKDNTIKNVTKGGLVLEN